MGNKYPGIRPIAAGIYEINFQIKRHRQQYRIEAPSMQAAAKKRIDDMAEYQKSLSLPEEEKRRFTVEFAEAKEKLLEIVKSETQNQKTVNRYSNVYDRMFTQFRIKHFPSIQSPSQLTVAFFAEYKAYYINGDSKDPENAPSHPNGWRSEFIIVRAIMNKLRRLRYCKRDLIDDISDSIEQGRSKRPEFSNIPDSTLTKYFNFVKKDRPDFSRPLTYIKLTGRRIGETTLLEKRDVVWNGLRPVSLNVRAETTKMKEAAPIPYLDDELAKIISDAARNNDTKWLFINRNGRRVQKDKLYQYLKKTSKEVMGVEVTPHYFRRRFHTICGINRVNPADAQAISGSKDPRVIMQHYNYATPEGVKKALEITRGKGYDKPQER